MSVTKSSDSRVWILKPLGPAAQLSYMGCYKIGDPSWSFGDVTRVECPDENEAGQFVVVDKIRGAVDSPTTSIMGRYPRDISTLLEIARARCDFELQALFGACKNKNDYNNSWTDGGKIVDFMAAAITQWSAENFGALSSDENNPTNETAEVSGDEIFEVVPVTVTEKAQTTVARELVSVTICDTPNCGGDCGDYSPGCNKVFAVQVGVGATPGTKPSVVYSDDGGATWASTDIDTMFSNETPGKGRCMGDYFIIPSPTSVSMHYAELADILAGTETWQESTAGYVAGGAPRRVWVANSVLAYVAGTGGYIYKITGPAATAVVLDAGVATAQTLNDIHGSDSLHVVAVGAANAVVYTENGADWQAVTGPAAGVALNCVWAWNEKTWLVGTAAGELYYTTDRGTNWTEIDLPIALVAVDAIAFSMNGRIAWLSGRIGASEGQMLRSTGFGAEGTWRVLPDTSTTIPASDRINDIAACEDNANLAYGAGLGSDASDGFLVKVA